MKSQDLIFRTWTEYSHGYTSTHVWISRYYCEDVAKTRDGAIDNKAGYGSADGAAYWVNACDRIAEAGHGTYYNSGVGLHWSSITVCCQHYGAPLEDGTQQYCSPSFEMGRHMSEIEHSLKLLHELGKPIEAAKRRRYVKKHGFEPSRTRVTDGTFTDPADLLAVLRRRKDAVEVEILRVGPNTWDTVFVPKRPRPSEYTLVAAHSAGMEVSA